jgi:putative ABC transport system permease protein
MNTLRTLRRRPAYALTATLVLALGIGSTAALYSIVDTVLLRPLPYPQADRLVTVYEANPSHRAKTSLIAPARLVDWNRMNQSFAPGLGISASYAESSTDTSGPTPERLAALRVAPGYFQVFGAAPRLGRVFDQNDDETNSPGAAVISYSFWTRRFARDPDVLGKRLILDRVRYTIVGVMPQDFTSAALDLWLPAKLPAFLLTQREARFMSGVGRLRAGVTIAQATADLGRVQAQLGRQYPATDAGWSAEIGDLKQARVGTYRGTLWMIFAAVALLLLLAIANIAGLTLAQLQSRARELAIRGAIGASRAQVIRSVMGEVAWLAALGALGGGFVAWLGVRAIAATTPGTLPRMAELRFDLNGWLFAVAVSALAALGFGLLPALQATRGGLSALLTSLNAGAPGGRRRLQRGLVVVQLALTVLLLTTSGLLLRSLYNLTHLDPGFNAANVLTFHVGAGWGEDRGAIGLLQTRLLEQLPRLPGVQSAGFTNFLPASNATLQYQIQLAGLPGANGGGTYSVGERTTSAGYLQTLGVPLLAGSYCPPMPTDFKQPAKALVNRSFVDTYLHGESVVGREVRFSQDPPGSPMMEIVGVVGDVRENSLAIPPTPFYYMCAAAGSWPDPDYVVRLAGSPPQAMAAIRGLVRQLAPNRALFGMVPLEATVSASLEQPRLDMRFIALFTALAMMLAGVGLYSLISLMVAARRREIGLRMALGARRSQVAGLVLADAAKTLAWGVAGGLTLSLALDRLLESELYGVRPADAATLAAAVVVLAALTGAAAWLPARRAATVDPLDALRES